MKHTIIFLLGIIIISCTPKEDDQIITGLKPVYLQESEFKNITSEGPKPFDKVGKIYKQGQYIYISDLGTGVHVINNSDPNNPEKVAFINIPGNGDMVARINAMYADNGTDLVTIDISNLDDANEVDRIENVYPQGNMSPQLYTGYFECVDPTKGIVAGWESAELINPKCTK